MSVFLLFNKPVSSSYGVVAVWKINENNVLPYHSTASASQMIEQRKDAVCLAQKHKQPMKWPILIVKHHNL